MEIECPCTAMLELDQRLALAEIEAKELKEKFAEYENIIRELRVRITRSSYV